MNTELLRQLLDDVASGKVRSDHALSQLKDLPFEDVGGFAHVDHHRVLRRGFPETIFCEGKTSTQTIQIAERILEKKVIVLATRIDKDTAEEMVARFDNAEYDEIAHTVTIRPVDYKADPKKGLVLIVSAGTSDIPVAREAAVTAGVMGAHVETIFDVGVAGIHRLLSHTKRLREAEVIVVVAGMEGALASVVGGLVESPVIAVPTSVGYGASFQGLSALLTMLNSCASGVLVVNIDNGYGAGYAAALINQRSSNSHSNGQIGTS